MEFKNLAEVTKLDEVPEGASVLAATAEGEVVRVPGDGLGGSGGGGVLAVFDLNLAYSDETDLTLDSASCSVEFDEFKNILSTRGPSAVVVKTMIEYFNDAYIECAIVIPRIGATTTFDVFAADNFIVTGNQGGGVYFLNDGTLADWNGDDPMETPEDSGGMPV